MPLSKEDIYSRINFIQNNEELAGEGGPANSDVLNRPVKELITILPEMINDINKSSIVIDVATKAELKEALDKYKEATTFMDGQLIINLTTKAPYVYDLSDYAIDMNNVGSFKRMLMILGKGNDTSHVNDYILKLKSIKLINSSLHINLWSKDKFWEKEHNENCYVWVEGSSTNPTPDNILLVTGSSYTPGIDIRESYLSISGYRSEKCYIKVDRSEFYMVQHTSFIDGQYWKTMHEIVPFLYGFKSDIKVENHRFDIMYVNNTRYTGRCRPYRKSPVRDMNGFTKNANPVIPTAYFHERSLGLGVYEKETYTYGDIQFSDTCTKYPIDDIIELNSNDLRALNSEAEGTNPTNLDISHYSSVNTEVWGSQHNVRTKYNYVQVALGYTKTLSRVGADHSKLLKPEDIKKWGYLFLESVYDRWKAGEDMNFRARLFPFENSFNQKDFKGTISLNAHSRLHLTCGFGQEIDHYVALPIVFVRAYSQMWVRPFTWDRAKYVGTRGSFKKLMMNDYAYLFVHHDALMDGKAAVGVGSWINHASKLVMRWRDGSNIRTELASTDLVSYHL